MTNILVSLINIMCGCHSVFDQIDSSLNPSTLLSDLMKELIVSGNLFYIEQEKSVETFLNINESYLT